MGNGERYRIGVDGGGSHCRARIVDPSGHVVGEGAGGPANIASDLAGAAASIVASAEAAALAAGLGPGDLGSMRAGLGLAGGNVPEFAAAVRALALPFATVAVASDAEIACLGAHRGRDGAILVLGTGSQGVVMEGGRTRTVGGWGSVISDGGSGAVLGRAACRRALLGHEGIEPASDFTRALMSRFGGDPAAMLAFAVGATPRDFAALAPLVFEHADRDDPVGVALRAEAVTDVVRLLDRLVALGGRRIALMGGLAARYRPLLPARFDAVLVEPQGDALDGAIALVDR